MKNISFFNEDIAFHLGSEEKVIEWISGVVSEESYEIAELNYIFCSDEHLLAINRKFLNHDFYTDIITFDNSNDPHLIAGDIFISVERVRENAKDLDIDFQHELHRVIIHGVLHLMGYDDKAEDDQQLMRKKEDTCLSLL